MKWFLRNEKKKRILFLGDEIIENSGLCEKLKYYFDNLCPERKIEIIKAAAKGEGISEMTDVNIFERLDSVISKEKPDTVVFLYGANDGAYEPFSSKSFASFKNCRFSLL